MIRRAANAVSAAEQVFVLMDANARTERRGAGGGNADSKVLGACGRDVLNDNEERQLALSRS